MQYESVYRYPDYPFFGAAISLRPASIAFLASPAGTSDGLFAYFFPASVEDIVSLAWSGLVWSTATHLVKINPAAQRSLSIARLATR